MLHGSNFGSRPDGGLDPWSRGQRTIGAADTVRDADQDLPAGRVHARHAAADRHNPRTDGASCVASSVHHESADGAASDRATWNRRWRGATFTPSLSVPSVFVPSSPASCRSAGTVVVDAYLFERGAARIASSASPGSALHCGDCKLYARGFV